MKFSSLFSVFVIFILLFGLLGVVSAQEDVSPDGESSLVDEAPVVDEAADDGFSIDITATSYKDRLAVFSEMLFRLIYNLVYLPFAAPLVQLLVQFTKRFTSDKINAKILGLFFSTIMFGIWIAANEIGYGGQFESVIAGITTIGVSLLGVGLTTTGSGKLYDFWKAQKIPGLGFSRTV